MRIKKIIYITIGCISLGLGAIGSVLPLLPTVPFLLVSAFCFAKSSEKLDMWFKNTNIYKNNLESFVRGAGMSVFTKIKIMATVTLLLAIGFIMMKRVPICRIALVIVWLGHFIYFVFFIKNKSKE